MARIEIDYNKIYHSKFDGDYIILKELPKHINSRMVLIKWLETGNEQEVTLGAAIKEELRDKKKREINYNKIYHSNNYGDFKILRRLENNKTNHIMVEVEFIDTGTIIPVRYCDALSGNIKDYYRKTMCGVACIGMASSYHPAYNLWEGIIHRCYDPKCSSYNRYGAKGVTVCEKWLCFEYFLEDLPLIDGYYNWVMCPGLYHIDKDFKQQNIPYDKKIYSLETCCFLQASDNIFLARLENNNRRDSICKYVGVRKINDSSFNTYINIGGIYRDLLTYPTEEMAAAAYNNACDYYYENKQMFNDVPYIQPDILIQNAKSKKEMCIII